MSKLRYALPLALLLPLVAGCAPRPASPATTAVRQACREAADRVYEAQNRADLSRRPDRDDPFSSTYVSGIVTRGISSRYGRDQTLTNCVQTASPGGGAAPVGVAPTFSPATPTLTPIQ